MQEQGLPDGLNIQCTGFLPLGLIAIANLLPEPVTSQWVTERTKDATLKRITVTVKSLLEAQFMGFYFFCITFLAQ